MKDVLFTNMDSHKLKGISESIYIIQVRSAPCWSRALALCKRSARPPQHRAALPLLTPVRRCCLLLALPGDPHGPGWKNLSAPAE